MYPEILREMQVISVKEKGMPIGQKSAEEQKEIDMQEQTIEEIQGSVYHAIRKENIIEHLGFQMVYKPVNYHHEKDDSYGMKFMSNTNFWPTNVQVEKVPQYVLGQGVLGRAFTGLGVIQIDERLHGEAFYEVLTHEMEHIMYPHLSEGEIRLRTRYKLPHKPIFH
ncbi:hypothetical protein JW968_01630 [Candidatus Woesearchaeota archaeon]|nr:hypothetical protein [Candidatus Woesearchaeota archaeon]